VQFQLHDPQPLLYHNEAVLKDGAVIGYLTSGAYGHHLGAGIGLGYVPCQPGETADELLSRRYEVEVAGKRFAAIASLKPLYDPTSARIRV
jgi:glycine cleavage system aminomethyltransferase T